VRILKDRENNLMGSFPYNHQSGDSVRREISAPSANIIPKWNYIRTRTADMNKISAIVVMRG
jgi:hypothetical protein